MEIKEEDHILLLDTGKYKLIYFYESESYELFDVVSDIGETTDLAEEYPTIAEITS